MEDVVTAAALRFRGQPRRPSPLPHPTGSHNIGMQPQRHTEYHTSRTSSRDQEPVVVWRQGGQGDPGRGLPETAGHVSVLLLADCSLRCVCWLGSSSQTEQACRSLGGLEIPEGQWEGGDPRGPLAQPPGVVVMVGGGGGGVCVLVPQWE